MPNTPPQRLPQAALDRLYTLWTISSLLTILIIVVLALLGGSRLQRYSHLFTDLNTQIEQLRFDLKSLEKELAELQTQPAPNPADDLPPVTTLEPTTTEPLAKQTVHIPAQPITAEPLPEVATDDSISSLLKTAVQSDDLVAYLLTDRDSASKAIQLALAPGKKVDFNGDTWARLALAAELLDRPDQADLFAAQATKADRFPAELFELRAGNLLQRDKTNEAAVYARRLLVQQPSSASAILLMTEAYSRNHDYSDAINTLGALTDHTRLPLGAKLRLGRILIALEDSTRLEDLLRSITEIPEASRSRVNFLRAVSAIHLQRNPEALAILDQLLDETPADYDVRMWRGVALLSARQFHAAREALAFADSYPNRPEALYWRGMLEIKDAHPEQAQAFLEKSLSVSPRFAPAWEALGMLEMNRSNLSAALLDFEKARTANEYRSSTHFLIALIHAKQLHTRESAAALHAAFRLDPTLVEQATQTEAFLKLFSLEQIREMAPTPDRTPPNTP